MCQQEEPLLRGRGSVCLCRARRTQSVCGRGHIRCQSLKLEDSTTSASYLRWELLFPQRNGQPNIRLWFCLTRLKVREADIIQSWHSEAKGVYPSERMMCACAHCQVRVLCVRSLWVHFCPIPFQIYTCNITQRMKPTMQFWYCWCLPFTIIKS